jgi:hypothetical protein
MIPSSMHHLFSFFFFSSKVDCTSTRGRPLCEKYGVQGFPTLKYGDIAGGDMDNYEGGRKLSDLKDLVLQLSPPCTPFTKENCSKKDLEKLETFLTYSKEDLDAEIQKFENMKKAATADYEKGVEELKAAHKKLVEAKQDKLIEIRNNGLANAMAVLVQRKKTG